jgi:hypothetical protein
MRSLAHFICAPHLLRRAGVEPCLQAVAARYEQLVRFMDKSSMVASGEGHPQCWTTVYVTNRSHANGSVTGVSMHSAASTGRGVAESFFSVIEMM